MENKNEDEAKTTPTRPGEWIIMVMGFIISIYCIWAVLYPFMPDTIWFLYVCVFGVVMCVIGQKLAESKTKKYEIERDKL